jgi:hypothetical protein
MMMMIQLGVLISSVSADTYRVLLLFIQLQLMKLITVHLLWTKLMKAQYNAESVLKVEVASPSEAVVPVYKLHGITSLRVVILILTENLKSQGS